MKLALLQIKLLKIVKDTSGGRESSSVVCLVNGALPLLIYYFYGRFGDKLGNLQNRPPRALMIPPEEAGSGW